MPMCIMAAILLIIALIAIIYLVVAELRQSSVIHKIGAQVVAEMKVLEVQLSIFRGDYEPCAFIAEYAGMDNPSSRG